MGLADPKLANSMACHLLVSILVLMDGARRRVRWSLLLQRKKFVSILVLMDGARRQSSTHV